MSQEQQKKLIEIRKKKQELLLEIQVSTKLSLRSEVFFSHINSESEWFNFAVWDGEVEQVNDIKYIFMSVFQ